MKSIFVLGECNQFRCLILEMNQRKYTTHIYDIDILIDINTCLYKVVNYIQMKPQDIKLNILKYTQNKQTV